MPKKKDPRMTLPKRVDRVKNFYKIRSVEDWESISASDILAVQGVGPFVVNKVRVYLAHRGLKLRGDNPPDYWLEVLGHDFDRFKMQSRSPCPFTVIRCTNETYPFKFDNIEGSDGNPLQVPIKVEPLYRSGLADYTIEGLEQEIQIERKADDLEDSLSNRRDAVEAEIIRLDEMCEFAAIVVERDWSTMLNTHNEHGASLKSISRTWISWSIRYPGVHWFWCNGRDHAENVTFRLLERFWHHKQHEETRTTRQDIMEDLFGAK